MNNIIISTLEKYKDITVLGTRESILEAYEILREKGIKVEDTFCKEVNYPYNIDSSKLLYLSKVDDIYIMENALIKGTKNLIPMEATHIMVEPILLWYKPYNYLIGQLTEKLDGKILEWEVEI